MSRGARTRLGPDERPRALAAAALLALPLACELRSGAGAPVDAPALAVERGSLRVPLLLTGELEAADAQVLSAPRTQTFELSIRWIAEDGATVAAGERLVEFDDTALLDSIGDLEIQLQQSGNELANTRAQQAVELAEKRFAERRAAVEAAKAQIDAEVPEAILSRLEYDKFQLAYGRAALEHRGADIDQRSSSRGASLDQRVQELALEKAERKYTAASEEIESLIVRAPQDGVMIVPQNPFEGRKLQVGDKVFPGFTVAKLPDLSKMVVRAVLSDVDDGRVHPGMEVACVLDAYPERVFPGLVRSVNPVAREPTRDASRRFFSVVIDLAETDEAIMRPGLSVQAVVLSDHRPEVLRLPRVALAWVDGHALAFDEDGDPHEVELGVCDAHHCELRAGLDEGSRLGPAPDALSARAHAETEAAR